MTQFKDSDMTEYKVKLNNNGRVVIPAVCRKKLHLNPGEELILRVEGNVIYMISLKQSLENAQSLVQKYAKKTNLLDKLRELRNEDN